MIRAFRYRSGKRVSKGLASLAGPTGSFLKSLKERGRNVDTSAADPRRESRGNKRKVGERAREGRNMIDVACNVPPLRGWVSITVSYPRLTPWATDLSPLRGEDYRCRNSSIEMHSPRWLRTPNGHGPNLCRYSIEVMKALTISALM